MESITNKITERRQKLKEHLLRMEKSIFPKTVLNKVQEGEETQETLKKYMRQFCPNHDVKKKKKSFKVYEKYTH